MPRRPTTDTATPERDDTHHADVQSDVSSRRETVAEASSRRERLFARPRWSWNIIAVVCLVAAAIALLNSYIDAAFVVATVGVVAWFLEVRNKYKVARIGADETDAESEFEENRDEP